MIEKGQSFGKSVEKFPTRIEKKNDSVETSDERCLSQWRTFDLINIRH